MEASAFVEGEDALAGTKTSCSRNTSVWQILHYLYGGVPYVVLGENTMRSTVDPKMGIPSTSLLEQVCC